jgi:DNA-binding beta-propeller fold protein YncE
VAYSPDGTRLAASASGDQTVKVWDAQTGQELLTCKGDTSYIWGVAYSPDGRRLASASGDRTVKVWDAQTGQELLSIKGHISQVDSVAFSSDGKRLASADFDGNVEVWDAQTGQELLGLKAHTTRARVAFSPDGKRLASASYDNTVKVWDAQTGQELRTYRGASGVVAFSPDGIHLASAGNWPGPGAGEVKVWDTQASRTPLTLKPGTIPIVSAAFSPDGKRLASGSPQAVKVWDTQTGQELLTLKGGSLVAFSPDGKRLVSAEGLPVFGGPSHAGQLLPPILQEQLNLTEQQKKELEGLQKQLAGKLERVLNDEQNKQLKKGVAPGGRANFGGGGRGRPQPGQILPPFVQQRLNLTAEQKKQLEELEKEADTKLGSLQPSWRAELSRHSKRIISSLNWLMRFFRERKVSSRTCSSSAGSCRSLS